MSYVDHLHQNARLQILRLLKEQPAYSANVPLIRDALEGMGIALSKDVVQGQVDWLAEQGLVTQEDRGFTVAKATDRGVEVAAGRARVSGVPAPDPSAT